MPVPNGQRSIPLCEEAGVETGAKRPVKEVANLGAAENSAKTFRITTVLLHVPGKMVDKQQRRDD